MKTMYKCLPNNLWNICNAIYFILFNLSAFTLLFFVFIILQIFILGAFFAVSFICIIAFALKNIHKNLKIRQYRRFFIFLEDYRTTMQFLFCFNRVTGGIFALWVLIMGPVNAYFFMWIVGNFNKMNFMMQIMSIILLSVQFFLVMFLHLLFTTIIPIIRRPARVLFSIKILNISLRNTILLSNSYCTISTTQHYGMTYGSVGLISIVSFLKVKLFLSSNY